MLKAALKYIVLQYGLTSTMHYINKKNHLTAAIIVGSVSSFSIADTPLLVSSSLCSGPVAIPLFTGTEVALPLPGTEVVPPLAERVKITAANET